MKIKQKVMWITSFLVLGLFSAYSVIGMFGLGANKAYAETLADDNFYKRGEKFMVVDKNEKKAGANAGIGSEQEICSLTSEQVAELDAFFKVDTFNLDVNGDPVEIAAVSGKRLTKKQLMDYLRASDQTLECRIVHQQRVFFFPVLPQIS